MLQGDMYFGTITAIDGNTITVNAMSGGRDGGIQRGERPEGEVPEGMQRDESPKGEMPEGAQYDERPEGEIPEGIQRGERPAEEWSEGMTPAEMPTEPMTITVAEDTVITINGENAKLAELQVGDSIMFTVDGDVVTTISAGMANSGMSGERMPERM